MINDEVQSLVEMYGKFGENEDRFIEETIINNMENYIQTVCKSYRKSHYYEDIKQDLRIFLLQCIKKKSIFMFKKYLSNRILRSRNKHKNQIHIPERFIKDIEYEYITETKSIYSSNKLPIYERLYSHNITEDNIVNRILIHTYATDKDMEIINMRNNGYRDIDIARKLNLSEGICSVRMNNLTKRIKKEIKYEN